MTESSVCFVDSVKCIPVGVTFSTNNKKTLKMQPIYTHTDMIYMLALANLSTINK